MRRRHFLQAAAVGAVSALTSFRSASAQMRRMPGAAMGGMTPRSRTTGSGWPTGLPLRRLGILEDTSPAVEEFKGALVAALIVGITDTFGRMLWPQMFGDLVGNIVANSSVYILMALVIAVRPAGLFGKHAR